MGFCKHASNASVFFHRVKLRQGDNPISFWPVKISFEWNDNFIGIQSEKKMPQPLGMRFYGSLALSVELSAFAWSANESIILHWVYVCVCMFAAFVYDHQGELDMTACWTECVLLPSYSFHCNRLCICIFSVATTRLLNTQYKCSSNWLIGIFFCVVGFYPFNGIFRVQNTYIDAPQASIATIL